MTARLRELAERWRQGEDYYDRDGVRACADELLAILDAESDGGAVLTIGQCASVIWHQGGPCQLTPGTKLYPHPTRSGAVSDADVEQAFQHACAVMGGYRTKLCRKSMRAALEHFAKGERHE